MAITMRVVIKIRIGVLLGGVEDRRSGKPGGMSAINPRL